MKWTKTQSVLDEPTVESLPPEHEDMQPTREESVKGHDTLATSASPLPPSLDPTPADSRAERISGPERNTVGTRGGAGSPEHQRSGPLQDHVPPHLELFVAQLEVPVRCAVRTFSLNLPSWSRSV